MQETKKRLEERLQEVGHSRLKDKSEGGSQKCLNNSESKGTQTSPVVFLYVLRFLSVLLVYSVHEMFSSLLLYLLGDPLPHLLYCVVP